MAEAPPEITAGVIESTALHPSLVQLMTVLTTVSLC